MNTIKIKLHDGAKLPEIRKGNCCDLYSARVGWIHCDDVPEVLTFDNESIMWFKPDYTGNGDSSILVGQGDILIVETGISMEMPEDWYNLAFARSSNFLKSGLMLTNSVGIIDHSYKGDNDTWKGVFYCTRSAKVDISKPLLQFTPIKDTIHQFEFKQVESLDNESRGGYGSTDK